MSTRYVALLRGINVGKARQVDMPRLREVLAARVLPAGALPGIGRLFPYQNIGSEFMPPLDEGDLLYMPTTFPGISPVTVLFG